MEHIKVDRLKVDIEEKPILSNIKFALNKGEIAVLLGPNGSGKTTLLKALNGLLEVKEGQILEQGNKVSYLNKSVMVFDEPVLYEELTGREHIKFVLELNGYKYTQEQEQISYWIKQFELEEYIDKNISRYSLGTKKKLQFLCALIKKADIILMDEYISGLDPQMLYSVKKIMKEYVKQGHTVLLSTHMLDMAERFCDNVILINNGHTYEGGKISMTEILKKYNSLENYYLLALTS